MTTPCNCSDCIAALAPRIESHNAFERFAQGSVVNLPVLAIEGLPQPRDVEPPVYDEGLRAIHTRAVEVINAFIAAYGDRLGKEHATYKQQQALDDLKAFAKAHEDGDVAKGDGRYR